MSNKNRFEELKSRLTAQQVKAAYLLVENEILPTGERKTHDEIAAEIGVDRTTLYRWRTRNKNFIEFKNLIADDFLATDRERVYGVLMKMIFGKQPSIKALELYFKRFGLLNDKLTVENNEKTTAPTTPDDVRERLKRLGINLDDEQ